MRYTITDYHFKMSQVCQVKRENYAVYVSSEEYHYY